MNTPHRASSLCCHETNDGRKSKLTHTPSMKAGQLSRHSCNQIPRGRHQHAKVQAGPEHHTRQPAGRKGKGDGKRNQTKGGQTTTGAAGPTQAQRGAHQQPEGQREAPTRAQNNTITRAPERLIWFHLVFTSGSERESLLAMTFQACLAFWSFLTLTNLFLICIRPGSW